MSKQVVVGTAAARPGEIVYGSFTGVELPTGGTDDLPVIIAQGRQEGPVLWVTASIHGDEYSGLSTVMKLLGPGGSDFPLQDLSGTVVLLPTLSPAGLRTARRSPYYNDEADPNRQFPAPEKLTKARQDPEDRSMALERVYARLFERIEATADYLIDLHNASLGSIPFSFRDPLYYADEAEKARMQELYDKLDGILKAFGMPIINEFPSEEYLEQKLHRAVSSSVLYCAHIPAFTVELGGYLHVDALARDAAVAGTRNVMRYAGMLPGPDEPMPPIPQPQVDFAVRRMMHPRTPRSGILTYLVEAGDVLQAGDAVALLTDIWGRPIGPDDGLLRTEHDGYVVGLLEKTVVYENETTVWLAVRDETEMLRPYPEV